MIEEQAVEQLVVRFSVNPTYPSFLQSLFPLANAASIGSRLLGKVEQQA